MSGLTMISLTVALGPLREIAAVQGLAPDEGRMLHHALSECFGKGVIQPFRLLPGRHGSKQATLYGYTSASAQQLRDTAAATAPPDLAGLFDLSALATKPMPDDWHAGRRFAFDLRCLPVRRLLRPLQPWPDEDGRAQPYSKGAEVDVYLVDAMRQHPDGPPKQVNRMRLREELYLAWLAERLAPAANLHAEATTLASFRRVIVRRGAQRQTAPEAVFHGELTIADPEAFAKLLAGGVGRHGAFGFGMLLLRPARG
jgi:CRISPR system Cascade subunit CasE